MTPLTRLPDTGGATGLITTVARSEVKFNPGGRGSTDEAESRNKLKVGSRSNTAVADSLEISTITLALGYRC